jgi:predicted KAP-like P-loop ATPase
MAGLTLVTDAPTTVDALDFDRYLDPLLSIIRDPYTQTPFTIGVFGAWGAGKSTLLNLLDRRLEKQAPDDFVRIHFNPWVHRKEPNMLVPLLHTLNDTLLADPKERFTESVKKIGSVLLRLGADILLKTVTADAVDLEHMEKLEEQYLKKRGQVESEIRNLRKNLQEEANRIHKGGAKLVFFIDDLDRCGPLEIIDLLESIKLFFDMEHSFIILALDKEVIDRGIEIKYKDFQLKDRQAQLGAEYLEKMIQLPLQLYPLHMSQVEKFIGIMPPQAAVKGHIPLLSSFVMPNPRKIKRILNIISVTAAVIDRTPALKDLKIDIVIRLVVMQVQSPELYARALKEPRLFKTISSIYSSNPPTIKDDFFIEYGQRSQELQAFCVQHCRPESYLKAVFQAKPFDGLETQLPTYFTMLGA